MEEFFHIKNLRVKRNNFKKLKINLRVEKKIRSTIKSGKMHKEKKKLFVMFLNWKSLSKNKILKQKILPNFLQLITIKNKALISQCFNSLALNMESKKIIDQTKTFIVNLVLQISFLFVIY